ncbi:GNAT family N-acetyltransferase [Rubellimicrobium rubrum]|uniref:GNAT family N-acetyltransferase n=1 Tax=Rubellimicrobium rubrum TaxID=2585369 RepID=A0A5C4N066_9RHOB|nr:GNAT family N-acetyltransferase [Rubellimicrobium rubrum]TNC49601.1 GNAT family N-acetyltransferase [Rubellimicrobium rubrum]
MPPVTIRPLRPDDGPHAARVFFDAVREGTRAHYTEAQRRAWAGEPPGPDSWRDRLWGVEGFAAEEEGRLVGFMTIAGTGYIDMAFVAPAALGRGVGWRLYRAVEGRARELGASVLTTEASRMARPFFERQGLSVIAEQVVVIRGVVLTNYWMRKVL